MAAPTASPPPATFIHSKVFIAAHHHAYHLSVMATNETRINKIPKWNISQGAAILNVTNEAVPPQNSSYSSSPPPALIRTEI